MKHFQNIPIGEDGMIHTIPTELSAGIPKEKKKRHTRSTKLDKPEEIAACLGCDVKKCSGRLDCCHHRMKKIKEKKNERRKED